MKAKPSKLLAFAPALAMAAPLFLAGCATTPSNRVPDGVRDQIAMAPYDAALVKAANDISKSLRILAKTQNARTLTDMPKQKLGQVVWQNNYTPPGMDVPITLDWTGPAEKVVKVVAKAANYDYRILGEKPVTDHIVSIDHQGSPAIDILRDLGVQMGSVADLVIFPSTRLIEIRYNANRAGATSN